MDPHFALVVEDLKKGGLVYNYSIRMVILNGEEMSMVLEGLESFVGYLEKMLSCSNCELLRYEVRRERQRGQSPHLIACWLFLFSIQSNESVFPSSNQRECVKPL